MAERLDATVALVTGALVARREERLDELAQDITRNGGRALVLETDMTDGRGDARTLYRSVSPPTAIRSP
jgi:NADP-dependent 3-hydroxy acid dehydrogenase YdfG